MTSAIKKYLIMALSVLFALTIFVFAGSMAGDTIAKADTTYATFTMENGAQVRTDNQRAIRFISKIEIDDLDSLSGTVKVVTMITPLRYLKSANLNSEAGFVKDANVNMKSVEFSVAKGNLRSVSDSTYYYFYACLYGVQEHNVPYAFAARSYIEQDGAVLGYTSYSEANNARSIYECAKNTIDNGLYDDDVEFDNLSALCKDYTVNVFSDQFADLSEIQTANSSNGTPVDKSITVKTGSRITDYYENMYVSDCVTVESIKNMVDGSEFSVDTAITTDLNLKVTYSVNHTLTDNVCDKCGFTMVEDSVPNDATPANWTTESEAVISTMAIADGVTVYNYVMDSTDTPGNAGLTLNVTNPNYAYLVFDMYVHSYKEDGNYNGMTMNYTAAGYNGKGMTFYTKGGANDGAIVAGSAIAVGQWYTCVLDLSYLGVTAETPKTLLIRPTQGDKSGVGMYLTNGYFAEKETAVDGSFTWSLGAGTLTPYVYDGKIVERYTTVNSVASINTTVSADVEYIAMDFNILKDEGGDGTQTNGASALRFGMYPWDYNLTYTSLYYEKETGNQVSFSNVNNWAIMKNVWYTVYIPVNTISGITSLSIDMDCGSGGNSVIVLLDNVRKVTVPDGSVAVNSITTENQATVKRTMFNNEMVYSWSATNPASQSNTRLYLNGAAGHSFVAFDFYINSLEDASKLIMRTDVYMSNTPLLNNSIYDASGNKVEAANLQLKTWYTMYVELYEVAANSKDVANVYVVSDTSDFDLYVKGARFIDNEGGIVMGSVETLSNYIYVKPMIIEGELGYEYSCQNTSVSKWARRLQFKFNEGAESISFDFKFTTIAKDCTWSSDSTYTDMNGVAVDKANLVVNTWYRVTIPATTAANYVYPDSGDPGSTAVVLMKNFSFNVASAS